MQNDRRLQNNSIVCCALYLTTPTHIRCLSLVSSLVLKPPRHPIADPDCWPQQTSDAQPDSSISDTIRHLVSLSPFCPFGPFSHFLRFGTYAHTTSPRANSGPCRHLYKLVRLMGHVIGPSYEINGFKADGTPKKIEARVARKVVYERPLAGKATNALLMLSKREKKTEREGERKRGIQEVELDLYPVHFTQRAPEHLNMVDSAHTNSALDRSESGIKRSRASKPKVRTGCQTCKYVLESLGFIPSSLASVVASNNTQGKESQVRRDQALLSSLRQIWASMRWLHAYTRLKLGNQPSEHQKTPRPQDHGKCPARCRSAKPQLTDLFTGHA